MITPDSLLISDHQIYRILALLQGGIVYCLLASPLEAVIRLANYILDRVCFLAERASNTSKCAKDSMLVKSITCQIDPVDGWEDIKSAMCPYCRQFKSTVCFFFP
jgi:hypothetical protein